MDLQSARLVLASASPARLALLRSAGLSPEVLVSGVDEDAIAETLGLTDPEALVAALAQAKADAVAATFGEKDAATGPVLVVGCDSVLDLDGHALGKPRDAQDARERWLAMRGRTGVLRTGHHLVRVDAAGGWASAAGVSATTVHFADLADEDIDAYVATGEPLQVAGAFTIDGIGGVFVERVEGDHGTVVGLSLPLLRRLTGQVGVPWTSLWA